MRPFVNVRKHKLPHKRYHTSRDDGGGSKLGADGGGRKRVAILISGSFRRFFLLSTAANLVKPMVNQGHTVDFFAFLMTGEHTPWKSDVRPYLKYLTWDPAFGPPSQERPNDERIRSTVVRAIHSAGGTVRYFKLRDMVALSDDKRLRDLRSEAQRQFPEEDPDSRFPTRSLGRTATVADANRNMLRLFRALEWAFDAMVPHLARPNSRPGSFALPLYRLLPPPTAPLRRSRKKTSKGTSTIMFSSRATTPSGCSFLISMHCCAPAGPKWNCTSPRVLDDG